MRVHPAVWLNLYNMKSSRTNIRIKFTFDHQHSTERASAIGLAHTTTQAGTLEICTLDLEQIIMGISYVRLCGLFDFIWNEKNENVSYSQLLWTDEEHPQAAETDKRVRDGMICALQIMRIYSLKFKGKSVFSIVGDRRNAAVARATADYITDEMWDAADQLVEHQMKMLRLGTPLGEILPRKRGARKGARNEDEDSDGNELEYGEEDAFGD